MAEGRFQPKEAVSLDPPKDDPIAEDYLRKCDGSNEGYPILVAIKGTVFDVSKKNTTYGPGGGYHIFAGKDASCGLGKSSLKPEHAHSDYSSLDESETKTLNDWYTFFSNRYNIVGKVVGNGTNAGNDPGSTGNNTGGAGSAESASL